MTDVAGLSFPHQCSDEFDGFVKSRKRSIFVIASFLNDGSSTLVKRDANFYQSKVCERGTICQWKVYERGTFFVKNGISKGKGLDLAADKFIDNPPPPPVFHLLPDKDKA